MPTLTVVEHDDGQRWVAATGSARFIDVASLASEVGADGIFYPSRGGEYHFELYDKSPDGTGSVVVYWLPKNPRSKGWSAATGYFEDCTVTEVVRAARNAHALRW